MIACALHAQTDSTAVPIDKIAAPAATGTTSTATDSASTVITHTVTEVGEDDSTVSAPQVPATPANKLRVIFWELDPLKPNSIANNIKNYDVAILMDLFGDRDRGNLLQTLKKVGFKYSTGILGCAYKLNSKRLTVLDQPEVIDFSSNKFGKDKNYTQALNGDNGVHYHDGGILIVSKFPIEKASEFVYSQETRALSKKEVARITAGEVLGTAFFWWAGGEFIGLVGLKYAKRRPLFGGLYARINKEGQTYNIIATAFYQLKSTYLAGHKDLLTVDEQINELKKDFVDPLNISKDEPVFLAIRSQYDKDPEKGCYFDTNSKLYNKFKETLDASDINVSGDNTYTHTKKNAYMKYEDEIDKDMVLDHIFILNGHKTPTKSTITIPMLKRDIKSHKVLRKRKAEDEEISSIYPICGDFEF